MCNSNTIHNSLKNITKILDLLYDKAYYVQIHSAPSQISPVADRGLKVAGHRFQIAGRT